MGETGYIGKHYIFLKKGKIKCPSCGRRTFVPLVDTRTNQIIEYLGKCDRYHNCGYKNYKIHDECVVEIPVQSDTDSFDVRESESANLDLEHVLNSMKYFSLEDNDLLTFFANTFSREHAEYVKQKFLIGTSNRYARAAVFWYISTPQSCPMVHYGKIMKYDPVTGKRLKEAGAVGSVNRFIGDPRSVNPTLFGMHLAHTDEDADIYVVESEKTAIIASLFYPQHIWMATGSLYNLRANRFFEIKDRNIYLIPDSGAFQEWSNRVRVELKSAKINIRDVWNIDRWPVGYDLADIIIEKRNRQLAEQENENKN
jgi:hypothetical protein